MHFLRTGRVDVPPSLHRGCVIAEAEFFCVTDFVEALAQEDREREEKEQLAALDNGLSTVSTYICTASSSAPNRGGCMYHSCVVNILSIETLSIQCV